MYCITASINVHDEANDFIHVRSVPTFYLDENVQGITDEAHAVEIARVLLHASWSSGPCYNTYNIEAVKV